MTVLKELMKSIKSLFDQFWKNHHNEYLNSPCSQLILEEWGFEMGGPYLVHIRPGEEAMYKVKDVRETLKILENNQIASEIQ
jgi:hypothetical protein